MKINCDGQSSHLSYCTNIHSGDTWEEVFPKLKKQLPLVLKLSRTLLLSLNLKNGLITKITMYSR